MMRFEALKDVFAHQVKQRGDKPFLIFPQLGKQYTYRETDRITDTLAYFFDKAGLKKGNIIAALLDNSPEIIFLYIACFKLGIVMLPVDPYFSPERIEFVLNTTHPSFVVVGKTFYHKCSDLLQGMKIKFIFDKDAPEGISDIGHILDRDSLGGVNNEVGADDVATLVFTSGTTGIPKGVPLKNKQFLYNIPLICKWLGLDENDNFLCVTPLYYNHGYYNSMLFVLYIGGMLTVTENFNIFVARDYWKYVADNRVTVLSVVPPIIGTLNRLYAKADKHPRLSYVKYAISGTAPLNKSSLGQFEDNFGIRVIRQYGLIETLLVVWDELELSKRKMDSTGRGTAGKVYIVDNKGNILGPNMDGEVVIDTKSTIDSYFNNEPLTRHTIKNGLFFTGDMGHLDEEGYLYLRGRKDDMINKGGNKISPVEIEEAISSCELVREAAVVAVPDEIYGEDVLCFAAKQIPDISDSEFINKIKEACMQKLQPYWCPSKFRIVENIPRGPTGKVLRQELRKVLN